MPIDASKVERIAKEQREALEHRFADQDRDFQLGDICIVVEVVGQDFSTLAIRNSGIGNHRVVGLLENAKAATLATGGVTVVEVTTDAPEP